MPRTDARGRGPLRVHAFAAATLPLALVVTACAVEPTPAPEAAAPAGAATDDPDGSTGEGAGEHIRVGVTGTASDSQLYIAEAEGFFDEQGIDVEYVAFDSGAQMIAPLGAETCRSRLALGRPACTTRRAPSRP